MNQNDILHNESKKTENNNTGESGKEIKALKASETSMDRRKIMQPRSKAYIYAMSTVDDEKDEKVEKIVKKMPLNNKLIGILSGCKIPGCIIHAIDKEGNILEHYQTENDIPEDLQEGYQVYLQNQGCFSVEVYTLYYCIVYENGNVKFLERNCGQ